MYVIRRKSDGWYYTGGFGSFSNDPTRARTYLEPHPALTFSEGEVWEEKREPWHISLPVMLGISLALWVGLYYLVRVLMAW